MFKWWSHNSLISLNNFQLLPRLKGIHRQKLAHPTAGAPDAYPHLQAILTRPIHWDLIRREYDQMSKYATALRLGTADAPTILISSALRAVDSSTPPTALSLSRIEP